MKMLIIMLTTAFAIWMPLMADGETPMVSFPGSTNFEGFNAWTLADSSLDSLFEFTGEEEDNESEILASPSGVLQEDRPREFIGTAQTKILHVSTGREPLLRKIDSNPVEITNCDIFVDMLVQFTVMPPDGFYIEVPGSIGVIRTTPLGHTVSFDDKISICLKESANGDTNLVVRAAKYTAGDVDDPFAAQDVVVDARQTILPNTWYRLTANVSIVNDGNGNAFPAFRVWLNGTQLTSSTALYDEDATIFPSLQGKSNMEFSAVGFSGEGMVDDLSFTTIDPFASTFFTIENGVLTAVELNGATEVGIPNGVTEIGTKVFYGCTGLTSVMIPDSVTNIQDWAFWGCRGLTNMTIPSSVTSIGYAAFAICTGLTDLTIPEGVVSIGNYAFSECIGLANVTIPASVVSINGSVFSDCVGVKSFAVASDSPLYKVDSGFLLSKDGGAIVSVLGGMTRIAIPDGVTSIGDFAFAGNIGMTDVSIPSSVASIGWSAFHACRGLTSVSIPSSVTNIRSYAFSWCSRLSAVSLLGDEPICGSAVFQNTPVTNYVTSAWNGPTDTWRDRPVKVVADAVATVGGSSVEVPGTWLAQHPVVFEAAGGNASAALSRNAANGTRSVAECYVLGINPEDENDDFKITSFEMVNGEPVFTFSHTSDGSGVSFEPRIRKLGKVALGDAWQEVSAGGNPAFRFFTVEVALP